jgi:hypothetical protein
MRGNPNRLNVLDAAHLHEVGSQFAAIAKHKYGFDEYGMFVKPSDFEPMLPCNFWRDGDGVIQHDMDFAKRYLTTPTTYYVNLSTGNDSTGTGAVGAPYKTIYKAMDVIAAAAAGTYCVRVVSTAPFMRAEGWKEAAGYLTLADKTVTIMPDDPTKRIILCQGQRGLTWTADGTGTWKATRSTVGAVYDLRRVDSNGDYMLYDKQASLAACQAAASSWYTDNTYVWVHTTNGEVPTDTNIMVCLKINTLYVCLNGTSKMYLKNVFVLRCMENDSKFTTTATGTATAELCLDDCHAVGGYTTDNGFTIYGLLNTFVFENGSSYSNNDGFNYHYSNVDAANRRDCLVVEYLCKGYMNGAGNTSETSNSTSCHDGASIIRFGCEGSNAKGPVLADVDGCYSICVDCHMSDSLVASGDTRAAYYFDDTVKGAGVAGKAILINCDSTGDDANDLALSTTDGFDVRLYAFTGSKFGSTATPKVIG